MKKQLSEVFAWLLVAGLVSFSSSVASADDPLQFIRIEVKGGGFEVLKAFDASLNAEKTIGKEGVSCDRCKELTGSSKADLTMLQYSVPANKFSKALKAFGSAWKGATAQAGAARELTLSVTVPSCEWAKPTCYYQQRCTNNPGSYQCSKNSVGPPPSTNCVACDPK